MSARTLETKGSTVGVRVVVPFTCGTRILDPTRGFLELRCTNRPPGRVTQGRLASLREHETVLVIVAPAAQIDGLSCPLDLRHPHYIHKEIRRLIQLRCDQFNMRKMRQQNFGHDTLPRGVVPLRI